MKNSLILIPVFAAIAAISACGNSGEKGRTLARIDGQTFTEGDLGMRLGTLSNEQREAVLNDPEQRRREFEKILHQRLHALAALKSPAGKSKPLLRRHAVVDQRVITQYYFENHLDAHGGRRVAEIEAYYNANPSRFSDDSGGVQALSKVLPEVVDSLIVSQGKLDSFFQANLNIYKMRASAEASMIQTSTRPQAEAALKALRGGMTFAAAAARFSTHSSKQNQGRIGEVRFGEFHHDIASQEISDSLFFHEKTRLQPGRHSGVIARADGLFLILMPESHTPEYTPPLDEVRARVVADYIREFKTGQSQQAIDRLKQKYRVRLVPVEKEPTEKEIQAYYNAQREKYESPETFELYHVESSDPAKLKTALASARNLEAFKALASRSSGNPQTRAQQGYIGIVKREFALPYGIGMMPELFPALDEIEGGLAGDPLQNPATQQWHAFWLVKKEAPRLKPIDRVRTLVVQDLKANAIVEIKPEDSLAVIGSSGRVIREDDVNFLREEIPESMRHRYTRENLTDYLIIWQIVTEEARALGLDKERGLIALRLQNDDSYWAGIYRDSILPGSWEEKPAILEKTFKAGRALFTQDSAARDWAPFAREIAASLYLNARDFELEYHTYPERYRRDTVAVPFDEARIAIFGNLKSLGYERLDAEIIEKLKKRFKVRIEDPALREPSLEPVAATYKRAQDLHYDRKLDQALGLYQKLREKYPNREGLQDSVSFGIAQIYIEQERYAQAMAEYRRVSFLYPKSPNEYKAMFMVGFIQAEHLRQDSSAVRSFEAMLQKHPSSDLSDDADWMIRNIRSGGQLMPVLEDDPEGSDFAE